MNNKKYIIIIVLVIILAGAVFLIFSNKIGQLPKSTTATIEQVVKNLEIEKNQNIEAMKFLDLALDTARQIDQDLDGLPNQEEKKIGTNSENSDTDGDGLNDGDEVSFYRTNPLKADTDGDSYKDGSEVKRGYSPLGPGKLIQ
ncbi:MAG: hypothetical protein WCV83_02920 [Candidatus Magasanikbacteria bacterium]|jgi:hypothetical protein